MQCLKKTQKLIKTPRRTPHIHYKHDYNSCMTTQLKKNQINHLNTSMWTRIIKGDIEKLTRISIIQTPKSKYVEQNHLMSLNQTIIFLETKNLMDIDIHKKKCRAAIKATKTKQCRQTSIKQALTHKTHQTFSNKNAKKKKSNKLQPKSNTNHQYFFFFFFLE